MRRQKNRQKDDLPWKVSEIKETILEFVQITELFSTNTAPIIVVVIR